MRADSLAIRTARATCVWLGTLLAANWIASLIADRLGHPFPHASFLADPADSFADFLKVALSYPIARPFADGDLFGLRAHVVAQMLTGYDARDPLVTAGRFTISDITHFHLTPLATALALLAGAAMRIVEPALVLLAAVITLLGYAWRVARAGAGTRGEAAWWFAAMLVSYPMLLALDRANLFAALSALLLIHALRDAHRGCSANRIGLLLALALNIRPNAAPLVLLALIWRPREAMRIAGGTAAAGVVIGLAALAGAHLLYPPYTGRSFLAGLERYYWLYVVGDGGLAAGSSLLGALKLLIGFRVGLDRAAAAVGLYIVVAGLLLRGRLDRPSLAFLVAAGVALGSAVYADYHLLVFMIVPMVWAIEQRPLDRSTCGGRSGIALIASWLVLAPKNYVFISGISLQAVINPLVLMGASAVILIDAIRAERAARRRTALSFTEAGFPLAR